MKTFQNIFKRSIWVITFFTMIGIACTDTKPSKTEAQIEAPDIDIHTAVITGNLDAVQQHIKAGTNINEKESFGGSSPLISAAVFDKTEIAKLLIDNGADLNIKNNDGSTALHSSAFFCRKEIVQMLIAAGADQTITNNYGATPKMSVAASFAEVKGIYEMLESQLVGMGMKLDYAYLAQTRPEIYEMLD